MKQVAHMVRQDAYEANLEGLVLWHHMSEGRDPEGFKWPAVSRILCTVSRGLLKR